MKKIFIIIISLVSVILFNQAFAISALNKAPTLTNSSATTLDITWEKNQDAMGYYLYYSKTQWKDYKSFWDAFETNKATVTNLQPNTTYYVVITSFDSQNNESFYSPEWVFNTKSFSDKFWLQEINPINFNEVELIFNAWLDSSKEAIREFKVTQNNKEVAIIKESLLNNKEDNKLNLIFDKNLSPWEYKLTIIYITDKTGRNIEEWIDWETKFLIPASFSEVEQNQEEFIDWDLVNNLINSVTEEENNTTSSSSENWWVVWNIVNEEDNIEFNSASEEENINLNSWNVQTEDYWLAWKTITWVMSTSEVVAEDNKKLPKTWPESVFIIFMALIFWWLLFYFKKRTI